jgi:hypothetical protein
MFFFLNKRHGDGRCQLQKLDLLSRHLHIGSAQCKAFSYVGFYNTDKLHIFMDILSWIRAYNLNVEARNAMRASVKLL